MVPKFEKAVLSRNPPGPAGMEAGAVAAGSRAWWSNLGGGEGGREGRAVAVGGSGLAHLSPIPLPSVALPSPVARRRPGKSSLASETTLKYVRQQAGAGRARADDGSNDLS